MRGMRRSWVPLRTLDNKEPSPLGTNMGHPRGNLYTCTFAYLFNTADHLSKESPAAWWAQGARRILGLGKHLGKALETFLKQHPKNNS